MAQAEIRLFVPDALAQGAQLTFSREQSHYLANVMRRKVADVVRVFNGIDGEWALVLDQISKKQAIGHLTEQLIQQSHEVDIWLVFAPVKNAAIHFLTQKVTELGASRLIPMLTQRTIVRRVNHEKLVANSIEAAEQCERLTVPDIAPLTSLDKIIKEWPEDRLLVHCDETGGGAAITEAIKQPYKKFGVLIGPEGGFTSDEITYIQACKHSFPVSLGKRILRADTAAMTALGCLQLLVDQ